ncbi:MAG TPA: hypothetical protein VJM33_12315 [Microthrixaceae bacterium]|nr:hypothetical protein [Microthrixaceae bacterium]
MGGEVATVGFLDAADDRELAPWARRAAWTSLVVCTLGLVAVAAAGPRGFDLSDEGWYWLAARHPLSFVRSSTQFQFPLNDLLDLIGWSVPAARILRLVLVSAATAGFGVVFVRLVRHRLGDEPTPTTWVLLAAVIAAAGFASTWYPPSPSYNDLALIGVLVGSAASVNAIVRAQRPVLVESASWFVAGLAAWLVLMVKFSAVGAFVAAGIAALVISWGTWTARRWVVAIASVAVGMGAAALVWHVRYLSLSDTLDGIRAGIDETSGSAHSPLTLLGTAAVSVVVLGLLGVVVWIGIRVDRGRLQLPVALGVLVGIGAVGLAFVAISSTKRSAIAGMLVPCLVAFVAYLIAPAFTARWREVDATRRKIVVTTGSLLAVLPLLYSFGTANPLVNGATPATAIWLILAVLAAAWSRADVSPVVGMAAPVAVAVAALAGVGLIWISPYDQVDLRDSTMPITDRSPISSVTLDVQKATAIDEAIAAMDDAAGSRPRNLLTFFSLPGLAYATDSATPGLLFEPNEVARTEGVIDRACAQRRPLFIGVNETGGALPDWVTERLASACRIDPDTDLRPLVTIEAQGDRVEILLVER